MIGNIKAEIDKETEYIEATLEERQMLKEQKEQEYQQHCKELADYVMQSEHYQPLVQVIKEKIEESIKRAVSGEISCLYINMRRNVNPWYETDFRDNFGEYENEFKCTKEIFDQILDVQRNMNDVIEYVYDQCFKSVLKENEIDLKGIDWYWNTGYDHSKYHIEFKKPRIFQKKVYSVKLYGISRGIILCIEQPKYYDLCKKYLGTCIKDEIEKIHNKVKCNRIKSEIYHIS